MKKIIAIIIVSVVILAIVIGVLIFLDVLDITGSKLDKTNDKNDIENQDYVMYSIYIENKYDNTKTISIEIENNEGTTWTLDEVIDGFANKTIAERQMKIGKYTYKLEHSIPGMVGSSEGSFIIEKGHTFLFISLSESSAYVESG